MVRADEVIHSTRTFSQPSRLNGCLNRRISNLRVHVLDMYQTFSNLQKCEAVIR